MLMRWNELHSSVHVWHVCPEALPADELARRCLGWLSPTERDRLGRFSTDALRHVYLATRALCRATLSHYTAVAPASWKFAENRYGKPAIAAPGEFASLRFNLTHTAGLVACAVTRAGEVGVDAEETSRAIDIPGIAKTCFSPDERADLQALPPDRRRDRFLAYWVVKEAYLKGLGTGLSQPSEDFTIAWAPDGNPRPLGSWQFSLTGPTPNHLAAVAIQQNGNAAPPVSWRPWDF